MASAPFAALMDGMPTPRRRDASVGAIASTPGLTMHVAMMILSGAMFSSLVLLDYATGMRPSEAAGNPIFSATLATAAMLVSFFRRWHLAACGLAMLFCFLTLDMYGLDAGYAVHRAGRGFPLVDSVLSQVDLALGYDWPAIFRFFVRHPDLTDLIRIPYDATKHQTAFVIVALMALGHHRRLIDFTSANFLSLFLVHLVALFLPALGTYAHAGLTIAAHPDLYLTTRAEHVPSLLAAREAIAPDLDGFQRFGIVTFPSYHAVTVVQFVWALWRTKVLRWLAIGWNAIVLLATPVHGSHYLCDILIGIAVAILAITSATAIPRFIRAASTSQFSTPDDPPL